MEAPLPHDFTERDIVGLMDALKPKRMWLSVPDAQRFISLLPERKYVCDERPPEHREQDRGLHLSALGVTTAIEIDFDLAEGTVRLEA